MANPPETTTASGEPRETLALYFYPSCGFCQRVLRAADELGVELELRDITRDKQAHQELVAARGRSTVPVLRRISEQEDAWMPESRDIIQYLQSRFG